MAQQLTSTEVNRVATLREEGHSQLYVAKQLRVVQETVEALETIPKNRYRNKASRYRSKE
jgi:transcriptional regulator